MVWDPNQGSQLFEVLGIVCAAFAAIIVLVIYVIGKGDDTDGLV